MAVEGVRLKKKKRGETKKHEEVKLTGEKYTEVVILGAWQLSGPRIRYFVVIKSFL